MNDQFRLKMRIWGVRGSIPTPRIENLGYGGNTPCLEVRTCGGEILVFDGGTGIHPLGVSLTEESGEKPLSVKLFLTHFHWDHIQGLPFFEPLLQPHSRVELFAPGFGNVPEEILRRQISPPYFPLEFGSFPVWPEVQAIDETPISFGDTVIHPFPLNHPQGAMGYRIESGGASITYASDLEHGESDLDRVVRDYAANANLLIYDAHYTPEEYEAARGWGHSTWLEATRVGEDAAVERLVLFHHHPLHTDQKLATVLDEARRHFENTVIAQEGSEVLI